MQAGIQDSLKEGPTVLEGPQQQQPPPSGEVSKGPPEGSEGREELRAAKRLLLGAVGGRLLTLTLGCSARGALSS